MKSVEEQLSSYKSVHFNRKNIQTHFVGIPIILLSIALFLSLTSWQITIEHFTFNMTPAFVGVILSLIYYFILHTRLALAMGVYMSSTLYIASLLAPFENALMMAVILFVVGWFIQFVGHYYEKAKPAFVDDLSQFLIGPLFLMAEVFFALGAEDKLNKDITKTAQRIRHDLEVAKRVES